jgi:mono/diheme cytochrome c family protein
MGHRGRLLSVALGMSIAILPLFPADGATSTQAETAPGQVSVWKGVYTVEQARRGATIYASSCAECHGEDLSGEGFAPPLVDEPFIQRWQDGTLADLFTVLRATMPQEKPGSLSDDDYAAIVSFLLQKNHFPAGAAAVTPKIEHLKLVTFQKP